MSCRSWSTPLAGLGSLYTTFGDLSGYPLDGPVPDDAIGNLEIRSISAQLRERVRREKPTIRELYLRSGITGSARIGTPTEIADAMQEWFENGPCDGFNITPAHLPGGCEDFVELVVPELQRRGLFRAEYEGKTLRENLGLKRPVSRYAAAGSGSEAWTPPNRPAEHLRRENKRGIGSKDRGSAPPHRLSHTRNDLLQYRRRGREIQSREARVFRAEGLARIQPDPRTIQEELPRRTRQFQPRQSSQAR